MQPENTKPKDYATQLGVTMPDNSMCPGFDPGSEIQMEVAERYRGDGVYALKCLGGFFVRHVQRVPEGFRIRAYNGDLYDTFDISESDLEFVAKLPLR